MRKKVIVGLSGGVDSSVAAYLLKKQDFDVTALFMINWHDTTGTISGDCPWKDDLIFAGLVAKKIGIPFHTVDFSRQYKKRIVDYMFAEYKAGRTPNPDVLCNREIKFDLFVKEALRFGADFIATGHYCRKESIENKDNTIYRLMAGDDSNKEQSYFLCQLSQEQLKMALFPIGHLTKPEVREIAREHKLPTADKKDSQGICFVGKVDLPSFLQQKLSPLEGDIIEIPADLPVYGHYKQTCRERTFSANRLKNITADIHYSRSDGEFAGKHKGAHYFTVGQNKGLNIGGKAEQSFVISTDVENNIIYTGQGDKHPGLYRKGLFITLDDVHWLREDLRLMPGESKDYYVRIRYRQPLQQAVLHMKDEGLYITFKKSQRGISPGQFAAWYEGNELLGSGVIV